VEGGSHTGGLAGYSSAPVRYSFSTGNVSGKSSVGGLIGSNGSIVMRSYSTGNVHASNYTVGGLLGQQYSGGEVTDSYATGDVLAGDLVGGLAGSFGGSAVRVCWKSKNRLHPPRNRLSFLNEVEFSTTIFRQLRD
jgi:hypothetical protein